ncbi:endonuclease [Noumeavirus]|uniref:endonuclease n=1 Tax=Noumeavirus TaxID=1955558 RepID=UPI000982CCFA|nr:endonuclease [Noumeavirus]AQM73115.1 restriction endonuclease [Noumeavirus]
MSCETKKRGKLCGKEGCKPCFSRSFASHENSKYLKKEHGSPLLIARHSTKKFWFECGKCGHSFEASPDNISSGRFCPFCSNQKLCSLNDCKTCFEKSFASSDKAAFWSTEKNKRCPREVFARSHKKFWLKCGSCEHDFEVRLDSVLGGYVCPFCSNGRLCISPECGTCFEKSFASSDKAAFWSTEKNKRCPREVFAGSNEKYWFECKNCEHGFEASLANVSKGSWCPFCSNRQLCRSSECKTCFEKSFASFEKAEFWSTEKNKQNPREVFARSGKKYWFECGECKHSFEAKLAHVSDGRFCPFCSSGRLCSSDECEECFKKSFASHKKAEFWIAEKNKQRPRDVFMNSSKKFWFECEKKHKFSSVLYSVSSGTWCSKCKNKTEAKLFSFLEENFEDPIHQFKVSWCKNPETGKFLPFDFCVSKTIIELDGAQHYKQVMNWQSPELIQKVDRYKEEQALKNGYSVLRILQEDVWRDKMDWKKLLLEHIKDCETPITKNLWDEISNPQYFCS